MRALFRFGSLALLATALAACGGQQSTETEIQAETPPPPPAPPYKPVATVADLMRSAVSLSAERYWESVSIIVDADGEHLNQPETDLDWLELWGDAMTLAETGNLLMMPPRAVDDPDWTRLSTALIDVSVRAAQVALDHDYEGVLDEGEQIYNVCTECHELFMPTLRL